jgi:EmrB/QacA subfamily drug resistance transporter
VERKWWTLLAICVAIFMLLLDITVVNTALPRIQSSLHASFAELQWVINAYALTLAAFLLTAGALADLFGRRLVFMIGLGLFTAASLLCGLSSSAVMLDVVRGVQGIGGAMMFATSLALIAQSFSGRERGTAFGIFGATIGGAAAIGPLVGGALTDAFGWEWIFFINVPIGIGAVFLTLSKVDESSDPDAARIDWWGVTTFSAALFMLVFALIKGNDDGWGSALILGLLVGSGVLLVAFVLGERAQERPMLDLTLFRRPAFAGASIVAFALSASMIAMFLYLTLYIQDLLGAAARRCAGRTPGSSIVTMLRSPSWSRPSAAYKVVVLPEPVGPHTSTAPLGSWIAASRRPRSVGGRPSASSVIGPRLLSRTRMTTASPSTVGRVTTRRSITRSSIASETRPSWGSRRSAMSRLVMILIRETAAATMRRGTRDAGTSTPSIR